MLTKPNLFSSKREDNLVTRDPRLTGLSQSAGSSAASPTGHAANNSNTSHPATTTTPATETQAGKSSESISGNHLMVGPDVKLTGAEILDCDTLDVEGRDAATMDSRVINIAEKGSFSGKVGIDVAEIHGHFEGELTARSQLIIHGTGRVSGTIRYGKIVIEEGGEISGDVRSLASTETLPTVTHRTAAAGDFPKAVPAVAKAAY
ncbi:MAG: polymer-forming cytoskeletal protein [Betaproteobacteria bacterium]|nr:polymer-forming cytoskeletal protein [Betaproteobacteria bacterium]